MPPRIGRGKSCVSCVSWCVVVALSNIVRVQEELDKNAGYGQSGAVLVLLLLRVCGVRAYVIRLSISCHDLRCGAIVRMCREIEPRVRTRTSTVCTNMY
jgi:hypothetical protein